MSGQLLVCGGVLIDDITFADGRTLKGVPGGAALYALAGAALWDDRVLLVSRVGEDAEREILPWMREADLAATAVRFVGPLTPRNQLVYRADGTRTETPALGPEHFASLTPQACDLIPAMAGARAAYIFRDADLGFWPPVIAAAAGHGVLLLWEVSGDACGPEHLSDVTHIAGGVDAVSINLMEARGLFGAIAMPGLLRRLRGLGAPVCFLRCGADGSFVITPGDIVQIPPAPADAIDVTGAGNAYGGGALAGLAAGVGPVRAAEMGAIAAKYTIAQHGPFAPRAVVLRAQARSSLVVRSN